MAQCCKFHECIILLFVTLILASKLPDQIIFYFRLNFILIPNWDLVLPWKLHIAQWIRLRLQSCSPVRIHIYAFFQFLIELWREKD